MQRMRIRSDDGDEVIVAVIPAGRIPGTSLDRLPVIRCETRRMHFSQVDDDTFETTEDRKPYRVIERFQE